MGAVANMASSFDVGNYLGPAFGLTPTETVTMSAIGGIGGARTKLVRSKVHTWQDYDNNSPSQPSSTEGAAPNFEERTRTERSNIVQQFKYGIDVSWTKQAATMQAGTPSAAASPLFGTDQPVMDELRWQIERKLERFGRDYNWTLLNGAYSSPNDNATARQMRGLRAAIPAANKVFDAASALKTVQFDATGGASEDLWTATGGAHNLVVGDEVVFYVVGTGAAPYVIDTSYWVVAVPSTTTFQLSATKGGAVLESVGDADSVGTWQIRKCVDLSDNLVARAIRERSNDGAPFRMPMILAGAHNVRRFSQVYGYAPQSRTLGGLALQQIMLDIAGTVPIAYERDVKAFEVVIPDLAVCRPVALPLKTGVMGLSPLPSDGDSDRVMLLGELGFEYGPAGWHVLIGALKTQP